jgi:hypothetical protein
MRLRTGSARELSHFSATVTDVQTIPTSRPPWYTSFYWRIGISFVLFVIVVLVAQSIMFSYMRPNLRWGAVNGRRHR